MASSTSGSSTISVHPSFMSEHGPAKRASKNRLAPASTTRCAATHRPSLARRCTSTSFPSSLRRASTGLLPIHCIRQYTVIFSAADSFASRHNARNSCFHVSSFQPSWPFFLLPTAGGDVSPPSSLHRCFLHTSSRLGSQHAAPRRSRSAATCARRVLVGARSTRRPSSILGFDPDRKGKDSGLKGKDGKGRFRFKPGVDPIERPRGTTRTSWLVSVRPNQVDTSGGLPPAPIQMYRR